MYGRSNSVDLLMFLKLGVFSVEKNANPSLNGEDLPEQTNKS